MKSLKINGVFCLFALLATMFAAAPAKAFNDGLSFDNSVTVTPNGNRSNAKRKHTYTESTTGSNADDYNFLGVQGSLGIANSSVSGATDFDTSSQLGMMWGAYYERRFIPYFGLRLEGEYNQRGFSQKDGAGGTNNFNVNFIEFALLPKAQFPTRIVTPFIAVGPFMGFAVAKSETASPQNGPTRQVSDLSQAINGFNFGLNFGGGIDFQIIRHLNVEIAARYSLGLLNMLTTTGQEGVADNAVAGASLHFNDIQFMSGVSYSL